MVNFWRENRTSFFSLGWDFAVGKQTPLLFTPLHFHLSPPAALHSSWWYVCFVLFSLSPSFAWYLWTVDSKRDLIDLFFWLIVFFFNIITRHQSKVKQQQLQVDHHEAKQRESQNLLKNKSKKSEKHLICLILMDQVCFITSHHSLFHYIPYPLYYTILYYTLHASNSYLLSFLYFHLSSVILSYNIPTNLLLLNNKY